MQEHRKAPGHSNTVWGMCEPQNVFSAPVHNRNGCAANWRDGRTRLSLASVPGCEQCGALVLRGQFCRSAACVLATAACIAPPVLHLRRVCITLPLRRRIPRLACAACAPQVRKAAEEALRALSAQPQVVPDLLQRIQSSQDAQVRQLAAVLLRKRVSRHWAQLSPEVRTHQQQEGTQATVQ